MSGVTVDKNDPALNIIQENGQQEKYIILSEKERAKGFIRPIRNSYTHNKCGSLTTLSQKIAETYARDPSFYGATFCVNCVSHFLLVEDGKRQFKWNNGSGVGE